MNLGDKMTLRWQRVIAGAAAGLAATAPMTVFMIVAYRRLPRRQQFELPPAKITGNLLRQAGIRGPLHTTGSAEALLSHFGYGAAIGAAYGGCTDSASEPTSVKGIAYALGVWTASYLGWLPASGLHRSATKEPAERNLLMLAAHVVWGVSFCAILRRLESQFSLADGKCPHDAGHVPLPVADAHAQRALR